MGDPEGNPPHTALAASTPNKKKTGSKSMGGKKKGSTEVVKATLHLVHGVPGPKNYATSGLSQGRPKKQRSKKAKMGRPKDGRGVWRVEMWTRGVR